MNYKTTMYSNNLFLCKIFAFIKKDFLLATSYKLAFTLHWLGCFIPLLIFYFITKLFGQTRIAPIGITRGGYLPFVLIGLAFMNYFRAGLGIFSDSTRREQLMGTLESILVSPTEISTIIISLGLYNLISAILVSFIYLVCGGLFFGVDFSHANILAGSVAIILTLACSISLSIISASFIMVYKMGDPITWALGGVSGFLGGVFFPVTILPKGLRLISYVLPITYSLEAIRLSLLEGYSLNKLAPEIISLLFFSIFLLLASMQIFKYAVKKAKRDGSLTHY